MTASTETITCKRCHRPLTSTGSRAAQMGPRCAAIEAATAGLKPEQAGKALEVIADGGVKRVRNGVYQVASTSGETVYLTSVKGICNCPHGLRAASVARCYHVAAARLAAKPRRTVKRGQFTKAA